MHRWEDNIKVDLKDTGCKGVVWIYLAQDVNTVLNLRIPYKAGNF
jgi:hypothetical protein